MTAKVNDSSGVFAVLRATPTPVRYLLGGVFLNQVGAFVQTFMVLYLTFQGFSVAQAGIALTAYSVGAVFGTIAGGELISRLGARATITGAMTTSAAILGLIPLLSTPRLFGVLVAAIALAGLATQSYRPAAAVLLSDLMPEQHRVMGFSMMRIALNMGAAVSPLIAAGLILINWDLLLWFDAATALAYAAVALVLLPDVRTKRDDTTGSGAGGRPAAGRRSGYAVVLRDTRFRYFLISVLVGTVIYIQYTIALPLKITADHHPTALYSAVLVTASVVLITCEMKITTYVTRWPGWQAATIGQALLGIGAAGYGLSNSAAVLILSTVVFVFGIMVSGPTMFAYPATFPAAVKARYVAAHQATFGLGMALGPVIGVLSWEHLGNGVWALCGGLGLLAAVTALLAMKPPAPVAAEAKATDPAPAAGDRGTASAEMATDSP